jgi:hypothetical protein
VYAIHIKVLFFVWHYDHHRDQELRKFGPLESLPMSLKLVVSRSVGTALTPGLKLFRQRDTFFYWNQKANFTLPKLWRHIGLCVYLNSFVTTTPDRGQQLSSHSSRFTSRKEHRYVLNKWLGGSKSRTWCVGEEKSLLPRTGTRTPTEHKHRVISGPEFLIILSEFLHCKDREVWN